MCQTCVVQCEVWINEHVDVEFLHVKNKNVATIVIAEIKCRYK